MVRKLYNETVLLCYSVAEVEKRGSYGVTLPDAHGVEREIRYTAMISPEKWEEHLAKNPGAVVMWEGKIAEMMAEGPQRQFKSSSESVTLVYSKTAEQKNGSSSIYLQDEHGKPKQVIFTAAVPAGRSHGGDYPDKVVVGRSSETYIKQNERPHKEPAVTNNRSPKTVSEFRK